MLDAVESLPAGRGTAIGSGILAFDRRDRGSDPNVAPAEIEGHPGLPSGAGRSRAPTRPAIVVALTDGANNAGVEPIDAAEQAADRGLQVFTIGFGTDGGRRAGSARAAAGADRATSRARRRRDAAGGGFGGGGGFRRGIDEETLQAVADLTGGTYSPAKSAGEFQAVFAGLPTTTVTRARPSS